MKGMISIKKIKKKETKRAKGYKAEPDSRTQPLASDPFLRWKVDHLSIGLNPWFNDYI